MFAAVGAGDSGLRPAEFWLVANRRYVAATLSMTLIGPAGGGHISMICANVSGPSKTGGHPADGPAPCAAGIDRTTTDDAIAATRNSRLEFIGTLPPR
jgi:hypothetical protein